MLARIRVKWPTMPGPFIGLLVIVLAVGKPVDNPTSAAEFPKFTAQQSQQQPSL